MSNIKDRIESHSKFGIKLGLDNIKVVLEELGNPQDNLNVIHIGGTNGKGSVSSIISSCLQTDGYLVGKYCSPYLIDFTEMFLINDTCITTQELEEFYQIIIEASKKFDIELTLYEVTTAIMFLFANKHNVDYLVLEVGLGGRMDATNVVIPKVSVITNISLDHTHILGDTISQIAYEKAGIIKPGVPLFTAETNPQALEVFRNKTDDIRIVNSNLKYKLDYQTFTTEINYNGEVYELNLFGVHQVQNFSLAVEVLNYLEVASNSIKQGVKNVCHPGRLERITNNVIFDGAHNPASAKVLVESMKNYQGEINIIFSVLRDKDISQVISELRKLSTNLTFIPLPDVERGFSREDFESLNLNNIKIEESISKALKNDELNLICGTFSLYKDVMNMLEKN